MKKTVYILLLISAATMLVLYLRGCPGPSQAPHDAIKITDSVKTPTPAPAIATDDHVAQDTEYILLHSKKTSYVQEPNGATGSLDVSHPNIAQDDGKSSGTVVNEDYMLQFRERYPSAAAMEVVQLEPMLADLARRYLAGEHIAGIRLPMPHGKTVDILITDHQTIEFERGVFLGQVTGYPYSEVILSYYNEAMNGSIIIPGVSHYEIAYLGQGQHLIMEIDPDKILPSAPPIIPPLIDDPD